MLPIRTTIKKATATPRGKILAGGILLILAAGITLTIAYWNVIKKGFIRNKVKAAVYEKSNKLYDIHYDDMELDEVSGYLSITHMKLRYDSAQYKILQQKNQEPPILFQIEIPSISISGVKTPQALLNKEIVGAKLHISQPVIDIIYTRKGQDSSKSIPTQEVYKQILGELKQIKIDTLLITGARIITRDLKTGRQKLLLLGTDILLRDLVIDSVSNMDTTRLMFAKHIDMHCSKLSWTTPNKLYAFSIDSVRLLSDQQMAAAKSFTIIPALGEEAYAKKKGVQADRFDIDLNNITIHQLNFQELFREHIIADNVVLTNSSIKIYRDMTLPPDGKRRIGTYPQQRIAQIPMPVELKSLTLKNTYIEYKEKGRIVQQVGKVIFRNLNGTFHNITNKKTLIAKNNLLTADINAIFLHKYPVKTQWKFYMSNPKGRFDVQGQLGALNAKDANEIIVPLGGARIEKGRVNTLNFNFKADDYGMGGTVKILYEDLKVSVLKKDDETNKLRKRKLASLGVNVLVKNNNPSGNKPPRIANIYFERDTTRSMFHMSWKTLMKGITETAMPK
ncbi:MAG: hypothetical protein KF862_20160 [Chitinophagaceae bacterium]|nr:hypothetical protein [Chitinophagaceae bacterium]